MFNRILSFVWLILGFGYLVFPSESFKNNKTDCILAMLICFAIAFVISLSADILNKLDEIQKGKK